MHDFWSGMKSAGRRAFRLKGTHRKGRPDLSKRLVLFPNDDDDDEGRFGWFHSVVKSPAAGDLHLRSFPPRRRRLHCIALPCPAVLRIEIFDCIAWIDLSY